MSTPEEYNQAKMDAGQLKMTDITALVMEFQERYRLDVDGKCGPKTVKEIRGLRSFKLDNPIDRARSAIGKKIAYKLGKGGYHPEDPSPSWFGESDCSGFVSWCLGISRKKNFGDGHQWVSTSDIYRDATGAQGFLKK